MVSGFITVVEDYAVGFSKSVSIKPVLAPSGATLAGASQSAPGLRCSPTTLRDTRHQPKSAAPYLPRYNACAPALFCRRRSHATLFCDSFHRLAVNNGGARVRDGGPGFAAFAGARHRCLAAKCGAVVVKDAAIRREVVRQHTPSGAGTPDIGYKGWR